MAIFLIGLGSVSAMEDNITDTVISNAEEVSEISINDNFDNIASISETNATVKNSTFNDFFKNDGTLKDNVTADKLIFEGEFSDISIVVDRPIKLVSNDATLINTTITVDSAAENVVIEGFSFNTALEKAIIIYGNNVTVSNNKISSTSKNDENILINGENCKNITIKDNSINVDTKTGKINGVILLDNVANAVIANNTIVANIPSAPTIYAPVTWEATYASYVIQVSGDNSIISENEISLQYSNVTGSGDSMYAIISTGDNSKITKNVIKTVANYYTYGISASGSNVEISENDVNLKSNYQANGISLSAPFAGNISENIVNLTAKTVVYGTNDYGDVSAIYKNNSFILSSHICYGLELMGSVKESAIDNTIIANGNFTIGIAVFMYEGDLIIENNTLDLTGYGLGNSSVIYDSIKPANIGLYLSGAMDSANIVGNKITAKFLSVPSPVEATGILVIAHEIVIKNNNITVIANGANGTYNSIYGVKINKKDDTKLENNTIVVEGAEYAYGVLVSGDDNIIKGNNITVTSNGYYAGAISVNNPFTGNIADNNIKVDANNVSYGIFSWGAEVDATYENNVIVANANSVYAIEAVGNNEIIKNNKITATGNFTIAIVSSANGDVEISNNSIIIDGAGLGTPTGGDMINSTNTAIQVTSFAEGAIIKNNNITANIPSSSAKGAGMIIESESAVVSENNINVTVSNVVGMWDSNYGVKLTANNVEFKNNNIAVDGVNYAYGMDVAGNNIVISNNNIKVTNSINYANGINLNRPFTGNISNNNINIKGKEAAYGTASSSWGDTALVANYTNNNITVEGKTAYGMQLLGDDETVLDNNILVNGDYTMGITAGGAKVTISNNTIVSNGTEKGSAQTMDMFGATNQGILIYNGNTEATITDNNVKTNSIYTVDVLKSTNNKSTVKDNVLIGGLVGDASVNNIDGVVVNNTPVATVNITSEDILMYEKNGTRWIAKLTTNNGTPIVNATITFYINGEYYNRTTNANGTGSIGLNLPAGIYDAIVSYNGKTINETASKKVTITILPRIYAENIELYFKNGTKFEANLLDNNGKPLAGANITFNINGVFYNRITDANGSARLNINLGPGTYIITTMYNGCMISNNVTVKSILVDNNDLVKFYKNGSQYTVKLLDAHGKALANETVTFNINGVFYTRTTNADGIANMTINLGPGEYIITAMYNGGMVSNNVTVLSVIKSENLVMDASARKPFVVTILDGQGNPLSGAFFQMNINGVLYNRTTDANGTAKLNINLNPADYIITIMYNGLFQSNTISVKP